MNIERVLLGRVKQPDHHDRVTGQGALARHGQPAAIEGEPVDFTPDPAEAEQARARLALVLGLERGTENAGQVADIFGNQEIVLHEAFDTARPGMVGVAHAGSDFGLDVQGEAVLRPAGQVMEGAAQRPQEVLRFGELGELVPGQHAALDQLAHVVDPVEILGDPEQGVEVPQAPLAVLYVGLDHIARVAHAPVTLVTLGEFGLDELDVGAIHDLRREAPLELRVKPAVAPHIARFEDAGADRVIGLGETDAVIDGARGVAHLEA